MTTRFRMSLPGKEAGATQYGLGVAPLTGLTDASRMLVGKGVGSSVGEGGAIPRADELSAGEGVWPSVATGGAVPGCSVASSGTGVTISVVAGGALPGAAETSAGRGVGVSVRAVRADSCETRVPDGAVDGRGIETVAGGILGVGVWSGVSVET